MHNSCPLLGKEMIEFYYVDDLQALQIIISTVFILGSSLNGSALAERLQKTVEYKAINCRKHSAVLTDFGAVGDGKTSNTKAFEKAIKNLSQYAPDGGAQLIVPAGKWLTGSFNLTSHFTLFLHKDAVLLASQVWIFPIEFSKRIYCMRPTTMNPCS